MEPEYSGSSKATKKYINITFEVFFQPLSHKNYSFSLLLISRVSLEQHFHLSLSRVFFICIWIEAVRSNATSSETNEGFRRVLEPFQQPVGGESGAGCHRRRSHGTFRQIRRTRQRHLLFRSQLRLRLLQARRRCQSRQKRSPRNLSPRQFLED